MYMMHTHSTQVIQMAKNKAWPKSCQKHHKRKAGLVIMISNKVKCKPKIIEGVKERYV